MTEDARRFREMVPGQPEAGDLRHRGCIQGRSGQAFRRCREPRIRNLRSESNPILTAGGRSFRHPVFHRKIAAGNDRLHWQHHSLVHHSQAVVRTLDNSSKPPNLNR